MQNINPNRFLASYSSRFSFLITVIFTCLSVSSFPASGILPETETDASIQADSYDFDEASGVASASGDVRLEYGGLILLADVLSYNPEKGEIRAKGNVALKTVEERVTEEEDFHWQTEELWGNLHDGHFHSVSYSLRHGEVYLRGPWAEYTPDESFRLHSAQLSTCEHLLDDTKTTHFLVQTRETSYSRPERRFRMIHSILKIGPLPIFYWPLISWHRDWDMEDISLQAGHKSDWGAFLIASRRWRLTDNITATLGAEYRTKRGLALALGSRITGDNYNSDILLYGMRDQSPPETEPGFNRRFRSEEDRYRMRFSHLHNLYEGWTLRLQADKLSDIDMLEEWFESEFDERPQPRSFADLRYQGEVYDFSILARPRINDFYTVVERMPELRLEFPRQPLFDTPFYYQSDSSLARLRMRWRDFDRPPRLAAETEDAQEFVDPGLVDPDDYNAWRLDSLHMLYHPFDLGNATQLTPRLGLRLTHYSRSSRTPLDTDDLAALYEADNPDRTRVVPEELDEPVLNYDSAGGNVTRMAGEIGMELSRKYQRAWPDTRFPRLNGRGARLITRPYTDYTYIPDPTEDRENLYHFDRVDRIVKQNFIRMGVENRLLTRRMAEKDVFTILSMNTYADLHLEKTPGGANLGNLATRLEFSPQDKLSFNTTMIVDMDQPRFNYAQGRLTVNDLLDTPVDFSLSHSYSHDYRSTELNTMGNTLIDYRGESLTALEFSKTNETAARLDFPIGDKNRISLGLSYDFNESEPSRQLVEFSRDLHCWTGVLRYERSGTGSSARTETSIMFYLSAFPGIGVGYGM